MVKHKVWLKLQRWKCNIFSQWGKEVLLKAVALDIPSYAMSCFKLSHKLCVELEGMIASYWWGQKKKERKIHWARWHGMCTPKSIVVLRFKYLEIFNMAMLAK